MINEARLISAIVNNKDIAPVLNSQNVEMLFPVHGDIWEYTKDYFIKNREIVPGSILTETFPDFNLLASEQTSGTVKHYLEQLRDEFITNQLERVAIGLAKDAGKKSNTDLIRKLSSIVSDLNRVSSGVKDLDITDPELSMEHYTEMKHIMELNGGVLGIRSGFDSIDVNYPTGYAPGQLIFIISRTNQGKSWLALDFAINAWAQGKRILYVSLEMSPQSVRDRAYTFMSKGDFKMSDLARASVDLDALKVWTNANMQSNGSFVVTASDGMGDFTPAQLQGKIEQYGPDLVVVDYLQLMSDNRGSTGETERVRNASKELKSLSMTSSIPIIAVAAASSHETKEYNTPPQIYETAGSKQAAFDADLVLSLISHKEHDGALKTEICARKNRNGPLFDFVVRLDIEGGTIKEEWPETSPFDEE